MPNRRVEINGVVYTGYEIEPVAKPRMTRGDSRQARPRGGKYRAFVEECQYRQLWMPPSGSHSIFFVPMPDSWSKRRKAEMNLTPMLSRPDVDNLGKAIMDAVNVEDSHIWDARFTKVWCYKAAIVIGQKPMLGENELLAELAPL